MPDEDHQCVQTSARQIQWVCSTPISGRRLLGIGLVGLLGEDAPIRHEAKRRRLRTVMQELVYVAARVVESGRRLALKFSRHCPAFPSFEAVYGKLAAG